jgi:predicted TPR repeat methyltransferase
MASGAHFLFSVQRLAQSSLDYHLGESHRFSHSEAYLRRALAQAGIRIVAMEEKILRHERGADVHGYIVLCEPIPAAADLLPGGIACIGQEAGKLGF